MAYGPISPVACTQSASFSLGSQYAEAVFSVCACVARCSVRDQICFHGLDDYLRDSKAEVIRVVTLSAAKGLLLVQGPGDRLADAA